MANGIALLKTRVFNVFSREIKKRETQKFFNGKMIWKIWDRKYLSFWFCFCICHCFLTNLFHLLLLLLLLSFRRLSFYFTGRALFVPKCYSCENVYQTWNFVNAYLLIFRLPNKLSFHVDSLVPIKDLKPSSSVTHPFPF